MPQRADVDARLAHVNDEIGDSLVLRRVLVGAGQHDGERRLVRPGRPDLLAVDDPRVTVALGSGGQRREVTAGAGLAEQLAPQLVGAHDRRQEAQPLLLGSVREKRGRGQAQAERVQPRQMVSAGELLDGARGFAGPPQLAVADLPPGGDQPGATVHRIPRAVFPGRADTAHRGGTARLGRLAPRRRDVAGDPRADRLQRVLRSGAGTGEVREVGSLPVSTHRATFRSWLPGWSRLPPAPPVTRWTAEAYYIHDITDQTVGRDGKKGRLA